MEPKIYISQALTYNIQGDRIYYEGPNPQSLRVEKHNINPFPQSRSFPNYPNRLDMTEYVSDLYKLKLT